MGVAKVVIEATLAAAAVYERISLFAYLNAGPCAWMLV